MKNVKTDVLVLNKSYCALHIIDWKKCMSLLVKEDARAMDREWIVYSFEDWVKFQK